MSKKKVAEDAWSETDRQWFEQHPTRQFMLRAVAPGEWDPAAKFGRPAFPSLPVKPRWQNRTLVAQIAPGSRMRIPVATPIDMPETDMILRSVLEAVLPPDILERFAASGML